ncbi:hypothetical protein DL98DRAFT_626973 [Cadophora sp. DSE1049]|nr:hypothetical protein DL98DRAFT_626973 [Cadophora sp. DSE1049]
MSVQFFGSQIGGQTEAPLSFTGSPWALFISDALLFLRWIPYLPNIAIPLYPWPSGDLDELYPSLPNIFDIALHAILFAMQATFIVSLLFLTHLPFFLYVAYIWIFILLNTMVCWLLNGKIPNGGLKSTEDYQSRAWARHEDECWIFLNGVAVGQHWLQSNIDRISRTFHRPVTGVHNKTSGIIFDVIQILIQRCLNYATLDVRHCYVLIKKALYTPGIKKVVLILHSQGGTEGSMILDWLLNEVPQDLLKYLEVYTFGNAANHFNNPDRDLGSSAGTYTDSKGGRALSSTINNRAIAHIEHYANSKEFVAQWGVLNFAPKVSKGRLENRFMGRVFECPAKGHMLNQHYLDNMFPLDPTRRFVREPKSGDFMDMDAVLGDDARNREGMGQSLYSTMGRGLGKLETENGKKNEEVRARVLNISPTSAQTEKGEEASGPGLNTWVENWAESWIRESPMTNKDMGKSEDKRRLKVRDLSRLWAYRNGGTPPVCYKEV